MHDWLLWWQQRGGPALDWHSSVLHEYVWQEDLEVKHQVGKQATPLSDIHCASFDVWVRDSGHHKSTTNPIMLSRLDAFDTWALCKILRLPYTRHMSNVEVRGTTGCSQLSHLVTNRRLRLFGHIARSSSREDHHRALAAAIRQVRPNRKRSIERLGSVQLRQTLALWTSALRLPGERALLEMNGDILWTQQCSSGVRSGRKKTIVGLCQGQKTALRILALTFDTAHKQLSSNTAVWWRILNTYLWHLNETTFKLCQNTVFIAIPFLRCSPKLLLLLWKLCR